MLKTMFLAVGALALVGTATLSAPAQAGMTDGVKKGRDCRKLAKMHYPDDKAMRKDFRKMCKEAVESGPNM